MNRSSIHLIFALSVVSPAIAEDVTFGADGFFEEKKVESVESDIPKVGEPPVVPKLEVKAKPDVTFGADGFFEEPDFASLPIPAPESEAENADTDLSFGVDGFFEEGVGDDGDQLGFDAPKSVASGEWYDRIKFSGSLAFEQRIFFEEGQFSEQVSHLQPSLVFEPELFFESSDKKHQFRLSPFFRYDARDSNRTHFDLREANWRYIGDGWDIVVGSDKVFWGVTESRHLVDVINQFDTVEDIDEEDKLGQPLINLNVVRDWGTVSAFVLPYFRERTFAGAAGRPRTALPVDEDNAIFAGSAAEWYPSVALRYKHSIGGWDLGASYFHGVGREPTFVLNEDGTKLLPQYELINQLGIDVQYTKDAWLWKLEAIGRSGQGDAFLAAVGGFEYTIYQIFDSRADLGLLAEYLYDGRSAEAPPTASDNDIFVGARYALNDTQDTSVLAGAIYDPRDSTAAIIVEAERRLSQNWKLEFEARLFAGDTSNSESLSQFAEDSFVNLRLGWYF